MIIKRHAKGKAGIEFGLLLAFVAIFCIAALQFMGTNITQGYLKLGDFTPAQPVFELLDPKTDPTPEPDPDPPLPPNL